MAERAFVASQLRINPSTRRRLAQGRLLRPFDSARGERGARWLRAPFTGCEWRRDGRPANEIRGYKRGDGNGRDLPPGRDEAAFRPTRLSTGSE
jgi:hypothetical protein